MNTTNIKPIATIAASALVAAAAVAAMVVQGAPESGTMAGDMSTGVTVTAGTPVSADAIPEAKPAIKGPAPLPTEEQGLPG
ncbi:MULTISPECIES: hypothetical protein [unclassified Mycobacterium]|uniref:hypothetical protein n=1 Tax=unclassified Mycobacterium TaxID=2642494 RepID=UPI0029C783E0|nr:MULTISPECIES: hypothetical protein [unclassified Mycobacterium]